jgi:hypothetical protein
VTVSEQLTLSEAGDSRIGAGERTVTVEVREQVDVRMSDVPVPGFGATAALAALAAMAVLTSRVRKQ